MDIIVESDRDRRTLQWLIEQVGEEAVEEARSRLTGRRKPYISNIAEVLGLSPPEILEASTPTEAIRQLAVIKKLLKITKRAS